MTFVEGKVALVTGGASGIGLAITKHLLSNGAKAVAMADISEKNGTKVAGALQKQYKDKVIFIKTDVTKEEDFKSAFEKTIQKFKNIDIVCNNAGILDEIDWEKSVAVNLTAVLRGTYLALEKYLPKHKSGKEAVILNTASVLGINTLPSTSTYCSTKHGVVGLGKSLANEEIYKRSGIRVLTICPGVVATNLIDVPKAKDGDQLKHELSSLSEKISSTDYIGQSIIQVLNEGKHGSIWVLENEKKPYEVEFANRVDIRKSN